MLTNKQIDKLSKIAFLYSNDKRKETIQAIRKLSKVDLIGLIIYRCEIPLLVTQSPAQRVEFEDTVYQAIETL